MLNGADRATNRELARIQKRLDEMYSVAAKEIGAKADQYTSKFYAMDEKKRALVASGDMSKDAYKAWREQKVFVGARWRSLEQQMADRLTMTDKMAMDYVNGRLPRIYATNYNAVARETNGLRLGVRFDLIDEATVRNLAMSDKTLLPYKVVNGKKAERWHTQRVNAEVAQGILQGESMQDIAARLRDKVGMTAEGSAMRNARTAVGSAQNKGRYDMALEMEKKGLVVKKRWSSIHDTRTRDAHVNLDGVEQDLHEAFHSDLGDIMYPKDPDAAPANVYNCRCVMLTHIMGVVNKDTGEYTDVSNIQTFYNPPFPQKPQKKVVPRTPKVTAPAVAAVPKTYSNHIAQSIGQDKYGQYRGKLDQCANDDVREVYEWAQDQLAVADCHWRGTAHHKRGSLYWDVDEDLRGSSMDNPMGVFFHESGHGNDYFLGQRTGAYSGMLSTSWEHGRFSKTIRGEVDDWIETVNARMKVEFKAHRTDATWLVQNGYTSGWELNELEEYARSAGVTLEAILSGKHKISSTDSWYARFVPKHTKAHAQEAIRKEIDNLIRADGGKAAGSLSDIVGGATKGKVQAGIGHRKVYWTGDARHYPQDVAVEAFAEMSEAYVTNPDSLGLLRKYLPQSMACFDEMMRYARGVL